MYNKAVHERLIEAAKTDEDFVFYPEVIQLAGLGHLTGDALSGALGRLFFAMIGQDFAADPKQPMLSAVAVSSTIMTPSGGFYALARDIGKLHSTHVKQELAFWLQEIGMLMGYLRTWVICNRVIGMGFLQFRKNEIQYTLNRESKY